MNISVLGAGAWGTALARLLCAPEHSVTLWGHSPEALETVNKSRVNMRFLPGIELPDALHLEPDLASTSSSEVILVAVPSRAFREVVSGIGSFHGLLISVTKGIEYETGRTMCDIAQEVLPDAMCATLSGPSFAIEVARDVPTAVVAASADMSVAEHAQQLFNRPAFRVYTSIDRLGVELGGALKNVVAIAAGIGDGLGYGDNTKAALVTRAISEIRRLGVACGAQADTFNGLSGQGDLVVTCFSRHSRNRAFGERIGRGEKAPDIARSMVAVAEGFPTCRSAYRLARTRNVVTPIIDEVYAMLYEGKNVRQAVRDLMTREPKPED